MRKTSLRATRGLMLLLVALLGLVSLTATPVAAQTVGCASGDDAIVLRLFDDPPDGVLTVNEIEALALTFSEGSQTRADLLDIVARARAQGLVEIRYDGTGPCAAATATSTTAPAATSTTAPATSTTAPGTATSTTAPSTATSTTAPGTATATTAPGTATSTTVPGTETATTAPGTETATAGATDPATSVATTAPDDDDDDGGVSELPDTGQGSAAEQGNATTLAMLLGGMALCIVGAFLWTQRRAS